MDHHVVLPPKLWIAFKVVVCQRTSGLVTKWQYVPLELRLTADPFDPVHEGADRRRIS